MRGAPRCAHRGGNGGTRVGRPFVAGADEPGGRVVWAALTEIQNGHTLAARPNRNDHFPNLVFIHIFLLCSAFLLTARVVCGQNPDSLGAFENPIVVTDCDSAKYFAGEVIVAIDLNKVIHTMTQRAVFHKIISSAPVR